MPTSSKKRKQFAPLPAQAFAGNRFRRVFIPTYERWVGTQANPWVIPDHDTIEVLQAIWNSVYLDVPLTVTMNDGVFDHVCFSFPFISRRRGAGCHGPLRGRLLYGYDYGSK